MTECIHTPLLFFFFEPVSALTFGISTFTGGSVFAPSSAEDAGGNWLTPARHRGRVDSQSESSELESLDL
jgi:hypothetical protein